MSRERPLLNGMYFDEIQAPNPEFRSQAEQGTQALAHPRARRSFTSGLATRLAPPVRPRAGLRAGKSRQRAGVLGLPGAQPAAARSYRVAIRGARRAEFLSAARISPPTTWAPASTSSSRSPGWRQSAAARRRLARGFQPVQRDLARLCRRAQRALSRRQRIARPALLAGARRLFDADAGWALPATASCELERLLRVAPKSGHELRCLRRRLAVRRSDPRRRTRRAAELAQAYPRGAKDKALAGC